MLASDVRPPAAGVPVRGKIALVHGFTQTRRSWDPIAERLAVDGYEVVSVDAPGHGGSGELRADMATTACWLGETAGRATYVGYSMGGRLALHLAVARPDLVSRLVLVSATAGIDDDGERAARRTADEQRAAEIERDGVAAFLNRWLALPLFANLPAAVRGLDDRLGNTAEGLAANLRLAGTGAQASLWPELPALPMPVLVVAGALDAKFVAIAERTAALIPQSELALVPDAGHVVHLEQPDAFLAALRRWLTSTDST